MTKNTSRLTMGGSEKSRFFDYFFRTVGDLIPKNSVFLMILEMFEIFGPSCDRNFVFFFWVKKKCQDSPHVMSKIHEFLEYDFKMFSRFSKKVEKKGFFWLLPHIEKLKKNTKKWLFLKNYKSHFSIDNWWKLKKKLKKQKLSVSPL